MGGVIKKDFGCVFKRMVENNDGGKQMVVVNGDDDRQMVVVNVVGNRWILVVNDGGICWEFLRGWHLVGILERERETERDFLYL